MPKVSVIVPNYNHEKYLRQRLDTIIRQEYRDFELIILDDKSTDSSMIVINDFIRSHSGGDIDIKLIENARNSGSPFAQWRKGIMNAIGEYVWVAESDDYASEIFLSKVMDYIDKNHLDLCFTQSLLHKEREGVDGSALCHDCFNTESQVFTYKDISISIGKHNILPNASSVVFKRNFSLPYLKDISKFRISGDWLLWTLIIKNCNKCGYISEPLNYYRVHSTSTFADGRKKSLHFSEAFRVLSIFKSREMPYDSRYWVDMWLKHNGYSFKQVISNNFRKISLSLIKLSYKDYLYALQQIPGKWYQKD